MDAPPTSFHDAAVASPDAWPGGVGARQVGPGMFQTPAAMAPGGGWVGAEGGGGRSAQPVHLDQAAAQHVPADVAADQFQGHPPAPCPAAYPPLHPHMHTSAQAGMLQYPPPAAPAHAPPHYPNYAQQPNIYGYPNPQQYTPQQYTPQQYHAASSHAPSPFPVAMPQYNMPPPHQQHVPHQHAPNMYPPSNPATHSAYMLHPQHHPHMPSAQPHPHSPGSAQRPQRMRDGAMAAPAGAPVVVAGGQGPGLADASSAVAAPPLHASVGVYMHSNLNSRWTKACCPFSTTINI